LSYRVVWWSGKEPRDDEGGFGMRMMRYVKAVVTFVAVVFLALFLLATVFVFHEPCCDYIELGGMPNDTAGSKPSVRSVGRPRRKCGQALRRYSPYLK